MDQFIDKIIQIEHGFNHIIDVGNLVLSDQSQNHVELAMSYLVNDHYQVRMLATYLLGQLSTQNPQVLTILKNKVALDPNWRVQEMLAKAFDHYCQTTGYEKSLPTIDKWLADQHPNVKRAVIEGLRIWTSRPYFKDYPEIAIRLISQHRGEPSEYLRRSVGNALRDISKKHPQLIANEVATWDLTDKNVRFTYQLAHLLVTVRS